MGRGGLIVAGVIVVVLILAVAAWLLFAVDRGMGPRPGARLDMIWQMDADGDGTITWDEFEGPERMFDRFDTDGNGEIDSLEVAEVQRRMEERLSRRGEEGGRPLRRMNFDEMDSNGDSVITEDEFIGPPEVFERIDADGDGHVTAEEMTKARPPRNPDSAP